MIDRTICLASCLLLAACATSGDPQTPDTDTDPTVTASFTTGPDSSSGPPDPTSEPDDDGGPTTDADGSSSGGGSGSATGDSTGATTGCVDGSEGCPCVPDADPTCDEGLLCVEDVCLAPMCPADTRDEPNDLQSEAIHYGDINDGAPAQQLAGVLSGTEDVDWWYYGCSDVVLEEVEPVSQIVAAEVPRLCVFLDCVEGGNPLLPDGCPAGTVEDQAPTGFLPGCCASDGSEIDLTDFNCPDSADDSLVVYFRVDDGPQDVCIDYTIDFHC